MELEELKKVWKKEDTIGYSKQELEGIFELRTKKAVDSINRTMFWDVAFMVMATAAFIVIAFVLGLKDRFMISGGLVFIATILVVHYRIKHIRFNSFHFETNGISTAIDATIKKMKGYIKIYRTILPVIAAVLFLLYQVNIYYYEFGSFVLPDPFSNVAIAVLIAIVVYLLAHWIANKMYGKGVDKLIQLSKDVHGEDNP